MMVEVIRLRSRAYDRPSNNPLTVAQSDASEAKDALSGLPTGWRRRGILTGYGKLS